jgi:hypothetical protein
VSRHVPLGVIAIALTSIVVTIYARLDNWKRGSDDGKLARRAATSPWMRAALHHGAIVLTVLLFLLSFRRFGERTGRLAKRFETTKKGNNVQRRMLELEVGA